MSKHTPGPWQLAEKYNCKDVRAVDGPYVADCNASAAIDWRTKEANARLIAAAPDLLAVARLVDDVADRIGHEPDSAFGQLGGAARAAIAKATGGEQ
ncbi:hypothetical protein [Stenotrophomonas maltophilia]|uniref:hypothetical protein n=1 Tax=Stenotrophomonas maltophilia TaxID=40324 RepID=UPI0040421761